ncbi:MAG TPA: MarR family transcriptional regulator [Candidatus Megaira endosymbiont of Nemacystus decipiens]|nr:MarR family transcriptional regulator [Candidatus Megaera endosymbiont of Nemacystus decipiens]
MASHDENTDKSNHPTPSTCSKASLDKRLQATGICILESPSFIFYKAYFSWKRMSDKVLEPAGLTHTQCVFLCVLHPLESKRQKPTQNDLARLTDSDVTKHTMCLYTLQKRGLIERGAIDGDERAKYSKLLPAGKQLIKVATKIMDKFEQKYFLPVNNDFDDLLQHLKNLTQLHSLSFDGQATGREAYQ